MSIYRIILFLILLTTSEIYGQEEVDSLKSMRQNFESFEYEKVIDEADSILFKTKLSDELVLEIYRMKAISHFSLLEDRMAENSFIEILKIDSTFNLDSVKTSPKIISFFNEVRTDFRKRIEEFKIIAERVDTLFITQHVPDPEAADNIKNAYLRSLILPGWGHLYAEESAKGWLFTSLSAVTLASSIYFIFDTIAKEDEYLKATNITLIPEKYDDYNTAYKMRNYSITAFAVIWLYTQIDLLLFSETSSQTQNNTELGYHPAYGLQLKYHFSF